MERKFFACIDINNEIVYGEKSEKHKKLIECPCASPSKVTAPPFELTRPFYLLPEGADSSVDPIAYLVLHRSTPPPQGQKTAHASATTSSAEPPRAIPRILELQARTINALFPSAFISKLPHVGRFWDVPMCGHTVMRVVDWSVEKLRRSISYIQVVKCRPFECSVNPLEEKESCDPFRCEFTCGNCRKMLKLQFVGTTRGCVYVYKLPEVTDEKELLRLYCLRKPNSSDFAACETMQTNIAKVMQNPTIVCLRVEETRLRMFVANSIVWTSGESGVKNFPKFELCHDISKLCCEGEERTEKLRHLDKDHNKFNRECADFSELQISHLPAKLADWADRENDDWQSDPTEMKRALDVYQKLEEKVNTILLLLPEIPDVAPQKNVHSQMWLYSTIDPDVQPLRSTTEHGENGEEKETTLTVRLQRKYFRQILYAEEQMANIAIHVFANHRALDAGPTKLFESLPPSAWTMAHVDGYSHLTFLDRARNFYWNVKKAIDVCRKREWHLHNVFSPEGITLPHLLGDIMGVKGMNRNVPRRAKNISDLFAAVDEVFNFLQTAEQDSRLLKQFSQLADYNHRVPQLCKVVMREKMWFRYVVNYDAWEKLHEQLSDLAHDSYFWDGNFMQKFSTKSNYHWPTPKLVIVPDKYRKHALYFAALGLSVYLIENCSYKEALEGARPLNFEGLPINPLIYVWDSRVETELRKIDDRRSTKILGLTTFTTDLDQQWDIGVFNKEDYDTAQDAAAAAAPITKRAGSINGGVKLLVNSSCKNQDQAYADLFEWLECPVLADCGNVKVQSCTVILQRRCVRPSGTGTSFTDFVKQQEESFNKWLPKSTMITAESCISCDKNVSAHDEFEHLISRSNDDGERALHEILGLFDYDQSNGCIAAVPYCGVLYLAMNMDDAKSGLDENVVERGIKRLERDQKTPPPASAAPSAERQRSIDIKRLNHFWEKVQQVEEQKLCTELKRKKQGEVAKFCQEYANSLTENLNASEKAEPTLSIQKNPTPTDLKTFIANHAKFRISNISTMLDDELLCIDELFKKLAKHHGCPVPLHKEEYPHQMSRLMTQLGITPRDWTVAEFKKFHSITQKIAFLLNWCFRLCPTIARTNSVDAEALEIIRRCGPVTIAQPAMLRDDLATLDAIMQQFFLSEDVLRAETAADPMAIVDCVEVTPERNEILLRLRECCSKLSQHWGVHSAVGVSSVCPEVLSVVKPNNIHCEVQALLLTKFLASRMQPTGLDNWKSEARAHVSRKCCMGCTAATWFITTDGEGQCGKTPVVKVASNCAFPNHRFGLPAEPPPRLRVKVRYHYNVVHDVIGVTKKLEFTQDDRESELILEAKWA